MRGFSRNKFTKWLLISAGFLLVVGAGLYIYKTRFSADTVVKNKPMGKYQTLLKQGIKFVPGDIIVKPKKSSGTKAAISAQKIAGLSVSSTKSITADDSELLIHLDFSSLTTTANGTKSIQNAALANAVSKAEARLKSMDEAMGKIDFDEQAQIQATYGAINQLNASGLYDIVQPNYIYQTFSLPNDTYINPSGDGKTWSRGAWGQTYPDMWNLQQTKTDQAWAKSTGKNVIVAVVDTGVDYYHPDLMNNILTTANYPGGRADISSHIVGYNFIDNSTDPMDDFGHGTHVAGTIAAIKNNGIGVAGVAPDAKIMPVKVLDETGAGDDYSVASGIRFAADNGANVINLSLGGQGGSLILDDAVAYATSKNVVVVVAAGNWNIDTGNSGLSRNPNVITVAASNEKKTMAFFSNFGNAVDISAPGSASNSGTIGQTIQDLYNGNPGIANIISTMSARNQFEDSILGGGGRGSSQKSGSNDALYARMAGTSMATPFVSGEAALILALHPNYTADQVKSVIYKSADDLADPLADGSSYTGWDPYSGYGIADPAKALSTAPSVLPQAQIKGPEIQSIRKAQTADLRIAGTASGPTFKNYTLSYGLSDFSSGDYYPTQWTQVSASTQPVSNNLLGVISRAAFQTPNKDLMVVRLSVIATDGMQKDYEQTLVLTPNEAAGFPVAFSGLPMEKSMQIDLNNDGKKDLLYFDVIGQMHAIDSNGKAMANWDSNLSSNESIGEIISFVDQNNMTKIAAVATASAPGGTTQLLILDPNSGFANYKTLDLGKLYDRFSVAAIKSGGKNVIALGGFSSGVILVSSEDKIIKRVANLAVFSMAVGDVNGDGNEELVVTGDKLISNTVRSGLFIINPLTGAETNGYLDNPAMSTDSFISDIKLGDLNSDGKLEYIVHRYRMVAYYQYSHDQLIVLGNNNSVISSKNFNVGGLGASFVTNDLTDVNNDGKPEIGINDPVGGKVYYFNAALQSQLSMSSSNFPTWHWITTNVDATSKQKEFVTLGVGSGFSLGDENRLQIYGTNGALLKSYQLAGSNTFSWWSSSLVADGGTVNLLLDTYNLETQLLHKFSFKTNLTGTWPTIYHDARNTNNYNVSF